MNKENISKKKIEINKDNKIIPKIKKNDTVKYIIAIFK